MADPGESATVSLGGCTGLDPCARPSGGLGKIEANGDSDLSAGGSSCHEGMCAASWARATAARKSVVTKMAQIRFTLFLCSLFGTVFGAVFHNRGSVFLFKFRGAGMRFLTASPGRSSSVVPDFSTVLIATARKSFNYFRISEPALPGNDRRAGILIKTRCLLILLIVLVAQPGRPRVELLFKCGRSHECGRS